MKKLFAIIILALVVIGVSQAAMTIEAVTQAAQDGDQVWYAPLAIYEYLANERAVLQGAPFTNTTAVPHGTVDQLTNVKSPPDFADEWIISVNGQPLKLSRLFVSLSALKTALKNALLAKAANATVIAATDTAYANSVDLIGVPILAVSTDTLDFGASETELSFNISNTGGGTLNWSITTSIPAKISVLPVSGVGADTVAVTVNRVGIAAGTYYPTVDVTSDGGNATITLTVVVE